MTDIPKPPFGAPCNRCGYCCRSSLCLLNRRMNRAAEMTAAIKVWDL